MVTKHGKIITDPTHPDYKHPFLDKDVIDFLKSVEPKAGCVNKAMEEKQLQEWNEQSLNR